MASSRSVPQPPRSPKTGIIVGVPSIGWASTLFFLHTLSLIPPLNCTIQYKVRGTGRYGDPCRSVAEQDSILLHEALATDADYLFLLEEDVILPQMALRRLVTDMAQHPEATIVTSIVTSKTMPPEPMVYRGDGGGAYYSFHKDEFFEITGCHMGATLIRLDQVRKMTPPPPVRVDDYPAPGEQTEAPEWFRSLNWQEESGYGRHTQDLWFCGLVRQQGARLFADARVQTGHFDFGRKILYGMPGGGPPRKTDAEVVSLGCGLDWDFIDGIRPLRVDLNEQNNPDFRADLLDLPESWTGRFDIAYSSHVLEHFDRYHLEKAFTEMVRVTKPGGEIRVRAPAFEWAVEEFIRNKGHLNGRIIDVIWGGRSVPAVGDYPEMYHKMGITRAGMAKLVTDHQLAARAMRDGYSDVYRMFKRPLSEEVREWLKDPEPKTFRRSFIPTAAEATMGEPMQEVEIEITMPDDGPAVTVATEAIVTRPSKG